MGRVAMQADEIMKGYNLGLDGYTCISHLSVPDAQVAAKLAGKPVPSAGYSRAWFTTTCVDLHTDVTRNRVAVVGDDLQIKCHTADIKGSDASFEEEFCSQFNKHMDAYATRHPEIRALQPMIRTVSLCRLLFAASEGRVMFQPEWTAEALRTAIQRPLTGYSMQIPSITVHRDVAHHRNVPIGIGGASLCCEKLQIKVPWRRPLLDARVPQRVCRECKWLIEEGMEWCYAVIIVASDTDKKEEKKQETWRGSFVCLPCTESAGTGTRSSRACRVPSKGTSTKTDGNILKVEYEGVMYEAKKDDAIALQKKAIVKRVLTRYDSSHRRMSFYRRLYPSKKY